MSFMHSVHDHRQSFRPCVAHDNYTFVVVDRKIYIGTSTIRVHNLGHNKKGQSIKSGFVHAF